MYRTLIVDDEELARSRLIRILGKFTDHIQIIGECGDGLQTLEMIEKLRPDLVFLDIEMPGMNGLEVARAIKNQLFIVFVTAYDHYAVEAFQTMAVNYILKPVDQENLGAAIAKINKFSANSGLDEVKTAIASIDMEKNSAKLSITVGRMIKLIPFNEIILFEADNKYTTVYTPQANFITERSLSDLEKILPTPDFIRIHRKHIINSEYIWEAHKWIDRKIKIILKEPIQKELIVSRNYLVNFKGLLV